MLFPFEIPKKREFDVIGFGTNAVDHLIRVPEYPAFDSKIELTDHVQAAGGEIASTMTGLQRLGLRTAYAGRFGDDDAGDLGWQSLVDEGVDMRFAERIAGASTQIAFIVIDERNGERTIIWKRDGKLAYDATDAPDFAIERASVLHFTPHDTAASLKMTNAAKSCRTVISIDIDKVFDGIEAVLSNVNILVSSADFLTTFLGFTDKHIALRELQTRFGCGIVGVTLGSSGSLLLCDGNFIETAGFSIEGGCVDTTGAGDAFRTGLLYGMISGESVEYSTKMANGVAALKCRALGARTSLPDEKELRHFLKKQ